MFLGRKDEGFLGFVDSEARKVEAELRAEAEAEAKAKGTRRRRWGIRSCPRDGMFWVLDRPWYVLIFLVFFGGIFAARLDVPKLRLELNC